MKVKPKKCRNSECGNIFTPKFSTLEKYCSAKCATQNKAAKPIRKPIQPISDKRKKETAQYLKKRIEFLEKPENKICFIDGCNKRANTVEHRAGRIGLNYLDETTWAPCCLGHNLELENNPELSKKYQLSRIHGGKRE